MYNRLSERSFMALLATFVVLLSISCSNPVDTHDDDHHEEPAGFVLKLNGTNVISQQPNGTLSGSFSMKVAEETDLIRLFFVSEDGDEFTPEDEEYSLQAEFSTNEIVHFEQHEEDGKWAFHLHAEAVGSTSLTLKLMHGGHSDFRTQAIPITVSE